MIPRVMHRRGIGWLMVLLPTLAAGCATSDGRKVQSTAGRPSDRNEDEALRRLHADMAEFLAYLEDDVSGTADRIEAASTNADVRKAALLWKIRVLERTHEAMVTCDPLTLLLDGWAFCVRQMEYLQQGEGKEIFGDQQTEAVATAVRLRNRIAAIARAHIPEDELPGLLRRIEDHAQANPIHGVFEVEVAQAFSLGEDGQSLLQRFVGTPLRSLARAGQDALDPTSRLADSVDQFTKLAEDYPTQLRSQAQLLWLQLEDSASVRKTLAGVDDVSQSSVRLAAVAEELPQRVREEVQFALEDLMAQQPELRQTIQEARETVEVAHAALNQAETVAASIERSISEASNAGKAWQTTAESVTATIKEIQVWQGPEDGQHAGDGPAARGAVAEEIAEVERPFDINDYARTAEALTRSSEELRALLAEVRAFVEGDSLEGGLSRMDTLTASALGRTTTEARAVIDHLTWRTVQICGLVFVLTLLYRLAASRWTARSAAGTRA